MTYEKTAYLKKLISVQSTDDDDDDDYQIFFPTIYECWYQEHFFSCKVAIFFLQSCDRMCAGCIKRYRMKQYMEAVKTVSTSYYLVELCDGCLVPTLDIGSCENSSAFLIVNLCIASKYILIFTIFMIDGIFSNFDFFNHGSLCSYISIPDSTYFVELWSSDLELKVQENAKALF